MTAGDVVMRAVGITKSYGATRALKGVDFEVRRGSVTVLFGENGAGKSTLMKILSGVESPTSGELELDGEPVVLRNTVDASRRGIAIIHQELSLAPNLSVRDNIFMGRELVRGGVVVDERRETQATTALLERLEEQIDPAHARRRPAPRPAAGRRDRAGTCRRSAGAHHGRTDLRPQRQRGRGALQGHPRAHRARASRSSTSRITSRRRSRSPTTPWSSATVRSSRAATSADIDINWVDLEHGRPIRRGLNPDLRDDFGAVSLELDNVSVGDPTNAVPAERRPAVSLQVRAGEIVCLYGLMGAGRTELLEALAGRLPLLDGEVRVKGESMRGQSIADRIQLGLALVPEDRQRDGLVQTMSVGDNLSLASILGVRARARRVAPARAGGGRGRSAGCSRQDQWAGGIHHLTVRRQPAEGRDRQGAA